MFDPNWHSKITWCPPRPSFTLVETNKPCNNKTRPSHWYTKYTQKQYIS